MFFNSNQLSNAQITLANAHNNPISYCWRDPTKYQDFAGNKAPICSSAGSKAIPQMHPKRQIPTPFVWESAFNRKLLILN